MVFIDKYLIAGNITILYKIIIIINLLIKGVKSKEYRFLNELYFSFNKIY